MNISATSGPIATKFYLKHRYGGGTASYSLKFAHQRLCLKIEIMGRHPFILNEARNKTVLGVFRNVNLNCLLNIKVANN